MVYDCFTFFNELDLLEIRLNVLNSVVDKFVLVEATKTHSGNDKPLYYEDNKERYSQFSDKIIHIIVDDYPPFETSWTYENHQRNCIVRGLVDTNLDDDIIISDLDEIPNPEQVKKFLGTPGIKLFQQIKFYYYLNYKNFTSPVWDRGTKMLSYKEYLCSDTRKVAYSFALLPNVNYGVSFTKIRFMRPDLIIDNGGWHFSYLGGVDAIINKIKSFSHQEYNSNQYIDKNKISESLSRGKDIFGRGYFFTTIKIDGSFPLYLQKNIDKYPHLYCEYPSVPLILATYRKFTYIISGYVINRFVYPFLRPLVRFKNKFLKGK